MPSESLIAYFVITGPCTVKLSVASILYSLSVLMMRLLITSTSE